MLDLTRFEEFESGYGNERKSERHSVTQREAEQVFLHQPLSLLEDFKHSGEESRFHALGRSGDGRLLHVSFTVRGSGTRIRVISARPVHRKERIISEKASQAGSQIPFHNGGAKVLGNPRHRPIPGLVASTTCPFSESAPIHEIDFATVTRGFAGAH
jgi:uncharacterized DUF497 family protein